MSIWQEYLILLYDSNNNKNNNNNIVNTNGFISFSLHPLGTPGEKHIS